MKLLPLAALVLLDGCGNLNEMIMGYTTPDWRAVAKSRDGRQFVTDGAIALNVKVAEFEALPEGESKAWFSEALYLHSVAERQELFGLGDIKASEGNPSIVVGPGELQLEEVHVSYLRNAIASKHRVAFWQHSRMQPVIIVFDGVGEGAFEAVGPALGRRSQEPIDLVGVVVVRRRDAKHVAANGDVDARSL